ncbi:hypothetical protein DFP72DRAFT_1165589 [Ephemerocybe angulata]|uniref:BTB domain-containing protein n=1 Tax=Ephemerocybe angulata TaxID=980116 RepID=A0A8H6I904_9AGAR|nr:hypothetical protein DFP72DRAFT_1165589 [Tulosesus angulatus]
MESSVDVGQREPHLGAHLNDEMYCWELVSFVVNGYVFNVPRNPFALGSEYFATKYLQPQDKGQIALEGVSPCQFRAFLKLMFPIHSTSTTVALSKSEWLTILTLYTLWHFLDLRKLAIQHLDSQMGDPIELVVVGRAEFVPRWVMKGYEALVFKPGPITEEESDLIGDRTAVRLYIIRHTLGDEKGMPGTDVHVNVLLRGRFWEEMDSLEIGDRERKSAETILQEKMEAEEAIRLEMEAARINWFREEEDNARRIREEKERLRLRRIAEEEKRERERVEKERKAAEEEERNRKIVELEKYLDHWQKQLKEDQLLQREFAEKARREDERTAAIRIQHSNQKRRPAQEPVSNTPWLGSWISSRDRDS